MRILMRRPDPCRRRIRVASHWYNCMRALLPPRDNARLPDDCGGRLRILLVLALLPKGRILSVLLLFGTTFDCTGKMAGIASESERQDG